MLRRGFSPHVSIPNHRIFFISSIFGVRGSWWRAGAQHHLVLPAVGNHPAGKSRSRKSQQVSSELGSALYF